MKTQHHSSNPHHGGFTTKSKRSPHEQIQNYTVKTIPASKNMHKDKRSKTTTNSYSPCNKYGFLLSLGFVNKTSVKCQDTMGRVVNLAREAHRIHHPVGAANSIFGQHDIALDFRAHRAAHLHNIGEAIPSPPIYLYETRTNYHRALEESLLLLFMAYYRTHSIRKGFKLLTVYCSQHLRLIEVKTGTVPQLETVELQLFLLGNPDCSDELADVVALVTL